MNGKLCLKTVFDGKKTVADDIFFTPPFKLYSPFYENDTAKFISMSATAGVLAGDENEIILDIGDSCNVKFTDQSYQKLFNTNGGISRQNTKITVGKNSKLIYLPHPLMTFAGCKHKAINNVEIEKNSTLCFAEIYCCGRTAMGEAFALKNFSSRTQIKIDKKTDFLDNTIINPTAFPVTKKGFFEGFTHTGILYIHTPAISAYNEVKEFIYDNYANNFALETACSDTADGLSVRALGNSGEDIFTLFSQLSKYI